MNKDQLQQELKEKIKEGIKPSDLKKKKTGENIGSTPTPPPPPPITNQEEKPSKNPSNSSVLPSPISIKIKKLEAEVKYWSKLADNYLKRMGQLEAELDNKDEGYESEDEEPNKVKELEKSLQEANQKIRDQEKTISDLDFLLKSGKNSEIIKGLQTQNKNLNKTIEELKKQVKSKGDNKEEKKIFTCSTCQKSFPQKLIRLIDKEGNKTCRDCVNNMLQEASKQSGEQIILRKKRTENQAQTFTCYNCQEVKNEVPNLLKLDSTLQDHPICAICKPTIKEFNEYDLITDEL